MLESIFAYSQNGTAIYNHPEAHPHFMDETAIEAINRMIVPTIPADPSDRSQTRICETVDFGCTIGFNYRTSLTEGMRTFRMKRGNREYETLMTADVPPTPVSTITSVIFWVAEENAWVLFTNHMGEQDPWPEPGTERFDRMNEADKTEAIVWFESHPLIANKEEIEKAKELKLIPGAWYVHVGEDEEQYGLSQPWVLWSKDLGPFETEEEAEEADKEWTKNKGERQWSYGPEYKFENTWYDKKRAQQKAYKNALNHNKTIIEIYEKSIQKAKEEISEIERNLKISKLMIGKIDW